ncbi:potassium transporter [Streptococcus cristatus]|uniref:potassium transporter n=1 Tax=Streptococcus cristatus TaxID=45634 RepID=UPI0028D340B1|nr:potassium transporter [Streptococcus cristatus]
MNKKGNNLLTLLICLVLAIVLLVVGMIQKDQTFIIIACANAALGCSFYAIGGQKNDEKDGDHGKKS